MDISGWSQQLTIIHSNCFMQKVSLVQYKDNNYMRSLQNSKSLLSFDNPQCRCFQTPLPSKQFFLSKIQMPKGLDPEKTNQLIPERIHHNLIKTSLKRSLKRLGSLPRKQSMFSDQEVWIEENHSPNRIRLAENGSAKLLKTQKTSFNSAQAVKIQPTAVKITFKNPYQDYNRPLIQYNSNIKHQNLSHINPQVTRFLSTPSACQIKKIETSKINFNFVSNSPKQPQSPLLPTKILKTQSMKNLGQTSLFSNELQLKIPKLQRKHSQVEFSDLGRTQTFTKNSIGNSGLIRQALRTQIEDKSQIKQTAVGFQDYKEGSFKNESNKISQTTKLKQNTYKSVINTKRSLLTQTNRSKIVSKKQKPKLMLSKMQDVEEIRSLADSDEQKNSDKESVVLGRLNEYQSVTINRNIAVLGQADLQRSLQFIQNSNSIIMDTPSGQWRYEAQSQFGY